jgi:hypothetical protein
MRPPAGHECRIIFFILVSQAVGTEENAVDATQLESLFNDSIK